MKSRTWTLGSICSLLVVISAATSTLYAAPIRVNCGGGGSINNALTSLASAGNTRGITILVAGTCRENVVITAFDHLTLEASPIATIQDQSNGTEALIEIVNSYDVTVMGFTLNGGSAGVSCDADSNCTLYLNSIQRAAAIGVHFGNSNGQILNNNISNTAGKGIAIYSSSVSTVSNTISGNVKAGVEVGYKSDLTATSDTIQNNAIGIEVIEGSVLRANDLTINGNSSDGVDLESSSAASFGQINTGSVITGNGGNGVSNNDLSFASFSGTNNVSGNLTQPDIACNPQYSATRGASTVGGTTNCTEPQHSK
jgi:hypothetical protein